MAAGVGSGVLEGFGRWEQDEVPVLAKVGESGFSGGKRVRPEVCEWLSGCP